MEETTVTETWAPSFTGAVVENAIAVVHANHAARKIVGPVGLDGVATWGRIFTKAVTALP